MNRRFTKVVCDHNQHEAGPGDIKTTKNIKKTGALIILHSFFFWKNTFKNIYYATPTNRWAVFRHWILRTKETKLICFFMDCTNSNEERIEDDDAVVFDLGSKRLRDWRVNFWNGNSLMLEEFSTLDTKSPSWFCEESSTSSRANLYFCCQVCSWDRWFFSPLKR